MKIYQIIDEAASPYREIGFLLYYEKAGAFAIELAEELSEEDAPIMLGLLLNKGIRTVDAQWSRRWVQQRIIPTDRQNLGMVLRENKLKEYDEMKLLLLGSGRCAQDDCAIREVGTQLLPDWMRSRLKQKLSRAVALEGRSILMAFVDEDLPVSKVDLGPWLRTDPSMKRLLQDDSAFHSVRLQPGGQGICWGENLSIAAEELCRNGESLPLTGRDLRLLIQGEVLDTAGVCSMLQCSRQYVDRLVREGTLRILNERGKTRMYDRIDVERLTW